MQNLQAHSSTSFYREVADAKRRTLLFFTYIVLAFLVLGAVIGLAAGVFVVGVIAGLVVGLVAALFSYLRGDAVALNRNHARLAPVGEFPRYHNLVEGLCIAAGLPKPRLFVVDDPGLNAFVVGRSPKHAAIAVTRGLLDALNRIELEGVLACELSHVKNYDILCATAAVIPSVVLGSFGARMMYGSTGAELDLRADAAGVQLTRYPPGLGSALEKMQAGNGAVRHASRATAPAWLVVPSSAPTTGRRPLEERIRVLEEM